MSRISIAIACVSTLAFSQSTSERPAPLSISRATKYHIFFMQAVRIENFSKHQEIIGNIKLANSRRDDFAKNIGITTIEATRLFEVAFDCLESIKQIDNKVMTYIATKRSEYPDGIFPNEDSIIRWGASASPILKKFDEEREQVLFLNIARLKSMFGDSLIQKIDKVLSRQEAQVDSILHLPPAPPPRDVPNGVFSIPQTNPNSK